MLKRSCLFSASLLVLAGCGRSTPMPAVPKSVVRPVQSVAKAAPWVPSLIGAHDGGFMFRDEATFRDYVNRSEVAAIGTLTSWEGFEGKLRVERVLRGRAGADIAFRSSGGFVRPKPGERFLVLLSTKEGRLVLHSFCAAGGLYEFSQPLANLVNDALQGRPLQSDLP